MDIRGVLAVAALIALLVGKELWLSYVRKGVMQMAGKKKTKKGK
jgi:hypothetical protein